METRMCGNSGLRLSVLGLGCWAFGGGEYWGEQSQSDVDAVVGRSVELGINYFDTAEAYNEGRSESSLGRAIGKLPREAMVIGTKISPSNAYAARVAEHCEASLRRLGLDYIDLYMMHWPIHPHSIRHFTTDEAVIASPPSVTEAFDALMKLKAQGKIRHVGVSNFAKPRLDELLGMGYEIAVNELPYSLLTRAIEREAMPQCAAAGIGIIGYMTLMQGVLADIYPTIDDIPAWQRRTRHFDCRRTPECRHGEHGAEAETNAALAALRKIAGELGTTMPDLAVRWVAANPATTCALVGARNIQELEQNVAAAGNPLPADVVEQLNLATRPVLEKLGPSFDYYESTAHDRTR
jgi:aryl-alcohol dehydrogenase-like predicted oxidoreductase